LHVLDNLREAFVSAHRNPKLNSLSKTEELEYFLRPAHLIGVTAYPIHDVMSAIHATSVPVLVHDRR
jgi:hypothetical protein